MLTPNYTNAMGCNRYSWDTPDGPNVFRLSGDVEDGTTYESHTFWVEFHVWDAKPDLWKTKSRPEATLWVQHGGGVERLDVRHMFARPLREILDRGMTIAAHRLCWGIFELARDARANGASEASHHIKQAFVEGRLKKRKNRGLTSYRVWVEETRQS